MTNLKKAKVLVVSGSVLIVLGAILVSIFVYAQVVSPLTLFPGSNGWSADFTPENPTIQAGLTVTYTAVVNNGVTQASAIEYDWYLDGTSIKNDMTLSGNSDSYTYSDLTVGVHQVSCQIIVYGTEYSPDSYINCVDTVTVSPTPTPTPISSTPTPYNPTPTPYNPAPSSTPIIPLPRDNLTRYLIAVFGAVLAGLGSVCLWASKHF